MNILNYVSMIAVPLIIVLIILYGVIEKKNVFDLFTEGTKDGISTTIKVLPTLIGLFLAVGAIKSSGILELIEKILGPILNYIGLPNEILPLAIMRPISRKCGNSYCNKYNERVWSRQ